MAMKCVVNKSTMTKIADAIRAKGGTTKTMHPSEMPGAIAMLPNGGVPYLETNGSSYVTTNILTSARDVEIGCSFDSFLNETAYDIPFGSRSSDQQSTLEMYRVGTAMSRNLRVGTRTTSISVPVSTGRGNELVITRSDISFFCNGTKTRTYQAESNFIFESPMPICIGGLNQNGKVISTFKGRFYRLYLKDTSGIRADFRPVKVNGVGAIKDIVSGRTFFSDTSTPFVYGE